jgi:hypothetical protein
MHVKIEIKIGTFGAAHRELSWATQNIGEGLLLPRAADFTCLTLTVAALRNAIRTKLSLIGRFYSSGFKIHPTAMVLVKTVSLKIKTPVSKKLL